ncbi:SRPBCC family protein [Sinomonas atrocyanea]
MSRISGSIFIRRQVEEVFDFLADERNEPAYNPQLRSVETTTPGPIGVGTQWRVVAASGRRSTPFELEVTEYARPSRLGSSTRMATVDISGALTFVPDAGGTRMSWSWDLRPKVKLAAPLLDALGRSQEQRIWCSLKARLESPSRSRSDWPWAAPAN